MFKFIAAKYVWPPLPVTTMDQNEITMRNTILSLFCMPTTLYDVIYGLHLRLAAVFVMDGK